MAPSNGHQGRKQQLPAVTVEDRRYLFDASAIRKRYRSTVVSLASLGCLALLSGPAFAATPASQSAVQPKLTFWMGTNDNGIFDGQTLDFIADNASIVVLNAPLAGSDGAPSYAQVVSGLHARNSQLPVLLYFWATRVYKGIRAGSVMAQNLSDSPNLLLKNPKNGIAMREARMSYGDVGSPVYSHWLIARLRKTLSITGADGAASDVAIREPFPQWCVTKPAFCKRYADGVDALFTDLKKAIKPKFLIFNGLWNTQAGQLAQQEPLLADTDGAAIEWFGRRQNKPIPPFHVGILPYLNAIERHPDKRFLVFARGSDGYTSYQADFAWQRYLYAAYLMAAGPNTSFRYLSTFQSQSTGRANMFTLYDDVTTKIGTPQGHYRVTGDLYSRKFSNGLALFVPVGGESTNYTLAGTLYRPDGSPVTGNIEVKPGSGWVLFNKRPSQKPFQLSFTGKAKANFTLPAANIVTSSNGDSFLQMKALPAVSAWQHDLLLDPVKTASAARAFKIRLRTKDPAAKVLVVAEVDDSTQQSVQAVAVLDAGACQAQPQKEMRISFRAQNTLLAYPHQCLSHFLNPDGEWHTYTLRTTGIFPQSLQIRRWEYVRFVGAMGLGYIAQAR